MKVHNLKTWPVYFERQKDGTKNFEVRKNDRDFQTGDTFISQYYDPEREVYGEELRFTISYVLTGGQFGIKKGYAVLGLAKEEIGEIVR